MNAAATPEVKNMPDPILTDRALLIWGLIAPMLPEARLTRIGRDMDGGYVIVDDIKPEAPIYSIGIGYDVSFDLALAKKGHKIYQFDHTVQGPPVDHENFLFKPLCLAAQNSEGSITLDKIIEISGHKNRDDIFLKIDVEGAEYEIIKSAPEDIWYQFDQIAIEFHRFINIDDQMHFQNVVDALNRLSLTHQIVHTHANNWGWAALLGGVFIPDTFEITYARSARRKFRPTSQVYPTSLDKPCNPSLPDYYLGKIGA